MASKLIAALAAGALAVAAVPSVSIAQEGDGIQTEEALGVIFVLLAALLLLSEGDEGPISP